MKSSQYWEVLNTSNIPKKLCVVVIPDRVVLQNESDRIQIFEHQDFITNMEEIESYECCNGSLVVNESEILRKDIFDYRNYLKASSIVGKYKGRFIDAGCFKNYFFFLFSGIYFLFFGIPIFYLIFDECLNLKVLFTFFSQ